MEEIVGVVLRVCGLRLFHLPIFPKLCLRKSLALYRTLARMGYPVEIHFGVHGKERVLQGHSWVTVQGEPIAERVETEIFKPVYSYSSGSSAFPPDEPNQNGG
jgi:hypothetical protein